MEQTFHFNKEDVLNLLYLSSLGIAVTAMDGRILDVNQCFLDLLGYPQDELIGANARERLWTSSIAREEKIKALQDHGVLKDLQVDVRTKTGQFRSVTVSMEILKYQGQSLILTVKNNMTEKIKMEKELALERELLMITLNSLNEGVIATDRENRIFLINETAIKLTGYSRFEATNEPIDKILYVLDDKTSQQIFDFSPPNSPRHLVLVTRELREISISINTSPIRHEEGKILGKVIVFQDMSEKQKIEQNLLKQQKLESLGILAGGIAHDFNNILTAILSNIQLAMVKIRNHEDINKYLLKTVETTYKASELTKQLLTFSQGGAPVKKDSSLTDLIIDTTEFVLRGATIKAEFTLPSGLWSASIDAGQISQVIQNMVINAKQASLKGGTIYIRAENISLEENSPYCPGNYVKITIRDQGAGIPEENLSKIFDPYFTTKKEGTGLGLAIAYSIITKHNGYIEVESKEGIGTSFYIYLPASNSIVPLNKPKRETGTTLKIKLKILLMDNEEIILNAVGEILNSYGHQMVTVKDGVEAIEAFKQAKISGRAFDVIIMDLTIPGGMGGQEAIRHIRDIDPKVKAIVSSGYANDPIMANFERYGFLGVVSKPYKIDELIHVLEKVIKPEQLSFMLTY